MGRKGIGKLSVFSLAQTVEVYSKTSDGDAHGLRIRVADLEDKIRAGEPYHPEVISVPASFQRKGTTWSSVT